MITKRPSYVRNGVCHIGKTPVYIGSMRNGAFYDKTSAPKLRHWVSQCWNRFQIWQAGLRRPLSEFSMIGMLHRLILRPGGSVWYWMDPCVILNGSCVILNGSLNTLLLTWFNSQHGLVITYPVKRGMKLLATVEVCERISKFIPHFMVDVIIYPCWY